MKKICQSLFDTGLYHSLYSNWLSDFYSFNQGGDMSGFTGFTLEHYSAMFADSRLMLILIQTFFLAF